MLPTQNCSLRRDLEKWFRTADIEPRVGAEFEDAALAKIAATDGRGFVVVPTCVASEAVERYGFVSIGRTRAVKTQFFAFTAERRLTHPAILAITGRPGAEVRKRESKMRTPVTRRK